jgi:hypothetical protein
MHFRTAARWTIWSGSCNRIWIELCPLPAESLRTRLTVGAGRAVLNPFVRFLYPVYYPPRATFAPFRIRIKSYGSDVGGRRYWKSVGCGAKEISNSNYHNDFVSSLFIFRALEFASTLSSIPPSSPFSVPSNLRLTALASRDRDSDIDRI